MIGVESEIRESGFKISKDLIVYTEDFLKSQDEEERKYFELPVFQELSDQHDSVEYRKDLFEKNDIDI